MRFFIAYIVFARLLFHAPENFVTPLNMTREMKAIAACESGNGIDIDSFDWQAVNVNKNGTIDTGAFQFNSYWVWNSSDTWIMKHVIGDLGMDTRSFFKEFPTARHAPPSIQIATFEYLWDNGSGWSNWNASKPCWSKWLYVNDEDRAVWRGN